MKKSGNAKTAGAKNPLALKVPTKPRKRLGKRSPVPPEVEEEVPEAFQLDEEETACSQAADEEEEDEYDAEEEVDESEDDSDDDDDDDEDEDEDEVVAPPAARLKKARTQPTVSIIKKRSSSRADPAAIAKMVLEQMEQGNNGTKAGAAAKDDKAEVYLTKGVRDTGKQRCFQRLSKRTFYPDLAMATLYAQSVFRDEMPGKAIPPSAVTELAQKMLFWMRHDVRPKFAARIKEAMKAPGNYWEVKQQDFEKEKEGESYRKGEEGDYSDPRFLHVVEHTFYKGSAPDGEAMKLAASEIAFVELGVSWLVFEGKPTFPSDTQAEGRKKYDQFLAQAQQGISNTRLEVAAKKAPADKQEQQKKKEKMKKKKGPGS